MSNKKKKLDKFEQRFEQYIGLIIAVIVVAWLWPAFIEFLILLVLAYFAYKLSKTKKKRR